jgi:hypothetical protein
MLSPGFPEDAAALDTFRREGGAVVMSAFAHLHYNGFSAFEVVQGQGQVGLSEFNSLNP